MNKYTGAEVTNCHVENVGVKHSPETASAIIAIANALSENAKALSTLSGAISGKSVTMNIDAPAFSLSNVNTPKE